ncbi:MAG: ABC transporter permease subunit [Nocardioides sp.]|uniref:ABC transporter permease subunit n=1 Tax=Nocardioides sp. TaxID=35761 RepID=UPI0039E326F4
MVARRLLLMIPTLFGIVTLTFILTHALGGNPARQIAGQASDPATIAKISHEYGFDRPLIVQYGSYLKGLLHGDLGVSTVTDESVLHDLAVRFPATLELVALSLALATLIGVPLGAYAARTKLRGAQRGIQIYTFIALAVPDFWLALIAIYLLYFRWGVLPSPTGQIDTNGVVPADVTGATLIDALLSGSPAAMGNALSHAILPVCVLGVLLCAPITRLMRSATLAAIESDFIRFGTSVGLGRRRLRRYAVRAAIPTIITFLGTLFTLMLGGAVLIESVFSWGGAAQYAATAIQRNDFAATQGFVLVSGFMAMVAFLIVDLVQIKLDPRIRAAAVPWSWRSIVIWRARRAARPAESPVELVAPESTAPAGGPRTRLAGIREAWSLTKEVVSQVRPWRWPTAMWRSIRTGNAALLTGGGIILVMVLAAFLVPLIWPYGATAPDVNGMLSAPSWSHPFGTDSTGFDIFIRVIVAARTDLWIAAAGIGLSAIVGTGIGLVAGYSRSRYFDGVVMRICDMIQAFPVLIVAIALVAFAGNSLVNVVWALMFINIPIFLRLTRSQVLTVRELRYVEAAHAMGYSRVRILVRHVLPNVTGPTVVQIGIQLGYALLTVAGLAFLGVGVQAPTPEWGSMILTGTETITTGQWWAVTFPGLAILVAVAAFNLLADGIERQRDIYR